MKVVLSIFVLFYSVIGFSQLEPSYLDDVNEDGFISILRVELGERDRNWWTFELYADAILNHDGHETNYLVKIDGKTVDQQKFNLNIKDLVTLRGNLSQYQGLQYDDKAKITTNWFPSPRCRIGGPISGYVLFNRVFEDTNPWSNGVMTAVHSDQGSCSYSEFSVLINDSQVANAEKIISEIKDYVEAYKEATRK